MPAVPAALRTKPSEEATFRSQGRHEGPPTPTAGSNRRWVQESWACHVNIVMNVPGVRQVRVDIPDIAEELSRKVASCKGQLGSCQQGAVLRKGWEG